ncbi:MAG TPA: PDZ domain-containing protein [Gemmataceae bacterium]|nr:PDZ domain-containing protein [Gemmataceae bacterium]
MRYRLPYAILLCLSSALPALAEDEARLLRFPTIHGQRLVFCYAGDLYTVSATGGIARRLTSHPGYEMFPHFSPDGKWIAFTGQYDGNTEIYVIPAEGGEPRRLTYTATLGRDDVSDRMGPNNIVLGWKHDGKHVLFRSRMHSFNDFIGQLYTVPLKGGLAEPLPLPRGGFASYSPDDKKLAYNRVFREFRTWKRYRGGMADDVWIHDFTTKKTENITANLAQDIIPMWHGDRIYYLSDRDASRRMNLFVTDLAERTTRQLTKLTEFDIKFPTLGDKAIVFENGGWIYRFDLATEKYARVPIRILEDRAAARSELESVSKNVTNFEISPDGKRALFGARGDVFTVPAKHGRTRNLTNTPGAHERNSKWSPDGKLIAFVSDASGEDEIWVVAPDGTGLRQLTSGGDTYKYEIYWSPNSKKILWSDKELRLQYVEVESKVVKPIAKAPVWEIRDAVWSPDNRWVAYSQEEREGMERVHLFSLEQGKTYTVTEGWYTSTRPAFSGDGKYLFFVSKRDFHPIYSDTEWNHAYRDMARIYLVTLDKSTLSPFRPRSDEISEPAKKEDKKKEEAKPKELVLKVDTDGLNERVLQLPISAANYRNLASVGSTLYYIRTSSKDSKPALQMYDLSARKETELGSVGGFEISADGKKMLVSQDGKYGIIDLPKSKVSISEPLKLSGMEMRLDHHKEWQQIYNECWRQMRAFFFDPTMHGVDWKAMQAKYEPLVPYVSHRADLTYIIGEMIGELNVGHTYVGGGDMPHPRRIPTGLLGARLRRHSSGYFQIMKILRGESWDPKLRSPLAELGLNVKDGDFLIAINGQPVNEMKTPYEMLVNQAGKQVVLKISSEPKEKGSREIVVVPIDNEGDLYYHEWVSGNIRKVHKATDGKVGYVHVPDMQARGLNQFNRYFYPQIHKKALIIDMRGNGGGNVSPMLIERLRREIAMIDIARNSVPDTDPGAMLYGPKVCLLNEFSASDGDLFPFRFRQHKLGKLIGKRSWGGVVGIRGTLPLLDGGYLNRPEFSRYDVDGKSWIIEGVGVPPDIEVDNDPARENAGIDDQLNRAIKEVLAELKTKEKDLPPPPPYPKK